MGNEFTHYSLDGLAPDVRAAAVDNLTNLVTEDADAATDVARLAGDLTAREWANRLGLDAAEVADSMTWRTFGAGSGAGPRRAVVVDADALLDCLGRETLTGTVESFVRDAVELRALAVVTNERTPWAPRVVTDEDELDAYQVARPTVGEWNAVAGRMEALASLLSGITLHALEVAELARIDEDTVTADAVDRGARFCVAGCYLGDDYAEVTFCECDEAREAEEAAGAAVATFAEAVTL